MPAFIDAHCHLLVVRGEPALGRLHRRAHIGEIQDAIRRAGGRDAGRPVDPHLRLRGDVAGGGPPPRQTRPRRRRAGPSRAADPSQRARHVLNSLALREAGIGIATEEPPGGVARARPAIGRANGPAPGYGATARRRRAAARVRRAVGGGPRGERALLRTASRACRTRRTTTVPPNGRSSSS